MATPRFVTLCELRRLNSGQKVFVLPTIEVGYAGKKHPGEKRERLKLAPGTNSRCDQVRVYEVSARNAFEVLRRAPCELLNMSATREE